MNSNTFPNGYSMLQSELTIVSLDNVKDIHPENNVGLPKINLQISTNHCLKYTKRNLKMGYCMAKKLFRIADNFSKIRSKAFLMQTLRHTKQLTNLNWTAKPLRILSKQVRPLILTRVVYKIMQRNLMIRLKNRKITHPELVVYVKNSTSLVCNGHFKAHICQINQNCQRE